MQSWFSAKLHMCVFTHQAFLLVWGSNCVCEDPATCSRVNTDLGSLQLCMRQLTGGVQITPLSYTYM